MSGRSTPSKLSEQAEAVMVRNMSHPIYARKTLFLMSLLTLLSMSLLLAYVEDFRLPLVKMPRLIREIPAHDIVIKVSSIRTDVLRTEEVTTANQIMDQPAAPPQPIEHDDHANSDNDTPTEVEADVDKGPKDESSGLPVDGMIAREEMKNELKEEHWLFETPGEFRRILANKQSLDKPEYNTDSPASFIIHVFTWRRWLSLKRLMDSLQKAKYFGLPVKLVFNIEGDASQEILDYVNTYTWPHGPVSFRILMKRIGLEHMIMGSWEPSSDHEYAIFLEDDIEVSPYYFKWCLLNMNRYIYGTKARQTVDERFIGISFNTPRINEIALKSKKFLPSDNVTLGEPFLFQLPCSWGTMYFPKPWRTFKKYHNWISNEGKTSKKIEIVPNSKTNRWTRSWKKHLIDLMFVKGWYLIYPNFKDQISFSTHHREPGEHTGKNGTEASVMVTKLTSHKNYYFTVPLITHDIFQNYTRLPDLADMKVVNLHHAYVPSRQTIVTKGLNTLEKIRSKGTKASPLIEHIHHVKPGCILDDMQARSPSDAPYARTGSHETFLLFQPQMGFNNQLKGIEAAAAYARLLNRTLVLPPLKGVDANNGTHWIPVKELFDLKVIDTLVTWIRYITFDRFLEKIKAGDVMKPDRMVVIDGVTKFLLPDNTLFEAYDLLPPVSLNVYATNRHDHDITRLYGQCQDQVLTFNTMFMTFFQFTRTTERKKYIWFKSLLWRLQAEWTGLVQSAISTHLTRPFACMHLRRTDFQGYCQYLRDKVDALSPTQRPHSWLRGFRDDACYPTLKQAGGYLRDALTSMGLQDTLRHIYVATEDVAEVTALDPARDGAFYMDKQLSTHVILQRLLDQHFQRIGAEEGTTAQNKQTASPRAWLREWVLPFIEQDVCRQADLFIGNHFSTFSRHITAKRGKNKVSAEYGYGFVNDERKANL